MATTGHESEAVNVQGLKASLQKLKIDYIDGSAYLEDDDSSAVIADFDPQADTVWKKQQTLSSAEKTQVQQNIGVYGRSQTYTKTEVNGLVSTPHQNYVTVSATDQTSAATDVLPASGQSADTIYRVSNWDGNAGSYDVTKYSEYAWDDVSNPNKYVFLRVETQIGEVFDISVYNNNAEYDDLEDALGTDGANVPESVRRGGMSVKFVQSSDHKYVQARCMAQNFTTDVTQWQGVDDVPTTGSDNLVKSGGVRKYIDDVAEKISVPIPYNSYIDGYINTSGVYVNQGAPNRSIQVYQLSKGDIVKIGGTPQAQGSTVATWAYFADSALSNVIKIGTVATEWTGSEVYVCPSNGYLAVCSFESTAKISRQTVYAYKIKDVIETIEAYTEDNGLIYKENGEITPTWNSGLVYYYNGNYQANASYEYCLIDVTTLTDCDAVRVRTFVNGANNICVLGYIDMMGVFTYILHGVSSGIQDKTLDIVPSQNNVRFILIGCQVAYESEIMITKLVGSKPDQLPEDTDTILCQGDSLVYWHWPQSVSEAITAQLGIPTINTAEGGENSTCVTARDGAIPMFLTGVNKGSLSVASSTTVEVELWDEFCERRLPMRALSENNISIKFLYLDDFPFVLTRTGTVPPDTGTGQEPDFSNVHYYITPSVAIPSKTYTTPVRCVTYAGKFFRKYIPLSQFGTNDALSLDNYQDRVSKIIARHKAIIEYHAKKDYFVLGIYPILNNLDAQLWIQKKYREAFGYRYIDIRQYLVDYGLSLCNITPTAEDLAQIAVGDVPTSLRQSSNTAHLTNAAQTVMCNYVVERVRYFMQNA